MSFYLVQNFSKTYPLEITLTETDEEIIAEYQVKIVKSLSRKYKIRTVIDYIQPDKPTNPYFSLLFDNGNCFLVDDSNWEEKEELVILKPWVIE